MTKPPRRLLANPYSEAAGSDWRLEIFLTSWFPDSFILLNKFYGDHRWMRLRRDTIRVEESAFCSDRLSLHRLPP
jgi:hypothetical protein